MPTVHYASRSFLKQQGVRCPPRTPDQIGSRLRRTQHHHQSKPSVEEGSLSTTRHADESILPEEPSAIASVGTVVDESDHRHCDDVLMAENVGNEKKMDPTSPTNIMDVPEKYLVADNIAARENESSGESSVGASDSHVSIAKTAKKRKYFVGRKSLTDSFNVHDNHEDGHDDGQKQDMPIINNAPKSAKFHVDDKIFARDRGILYEATVLKCQYDDQQKGWKYHVHYLGFKKSHDKWISANDMMKITRSSSENYRESRVLPREEKNGAQKKGGNPKSEKFHVDEDIFARDRGILYEATVLKCQYDDQQHVWKYHVHYLGFKKSHDKWLSANDMMKITPSNLEHYRASRGLSWEEKDGEKVVGFTQKKGGNRYEKLIHGSFDASDSHVSIAKTTKKRKYCVGEKYQPRKRKYYIERKSLTRKSMTI